MSGGLVVKICLVSDIHHGKNNYSNIYNDAIPLINEFHEFCNLHKPDLVMELGDRINDSTYETDFKLASEVAEAFTKNKYKIFHLNGNHDICNLSAKDNANIFQQNEESEYLELEDINVAIWRAETRLENSRSFRGIHIQESDLSWLAEICNSNTKPLLIFSHVPLSGKNQLGNVFFENNLELSRYAKFREIRTILKSSLAPTYCFAGHIHQNSYCQIDGISHFTQQSLTETYVTNNEISCTMGLIEVNQTLKWQAFGNDEVKIEEPVNRRNVALPIGKIAPND